MMLNWDDYNQEENSAVTAPGPAVVAAAAAAQQVAEALSLIHI